MTSPNTTIPPWFSVLEAVRELSKQADDGRFTAPDLAGAFRGTEKSSAAQIASAWLSKFTRWGYVAVVDRAQLGGIRPTNTYALTEEGFNLKLQPGPRQKAADLLGAVLDFRSARGTKKEAAALKRMFAAADAVVEKSSR